MNTSSTVEEISDDSLLPKKKSDEVQHGRGKCRTTKRSPEENDELSTSSSEEFEVIKEKVDVSDTDASKNLHSISLKNQLNADKLGQSWVASDNDENLRKFSKNYDDSASSVLLNDSEIEKQSEDDKAIQLNDGTEQSNKEYSPLKNYSALIAFSFLFIIASSLVVPILHFRFVQDEESTRKESAKDAIIVEQNEIIEKLRLEIENLRKLLSEKSSLLIGSVIDEKRLSAFERKIGYDYRLVIVDWKKADEADHVHRSRQHLRLSLKQCNGKFFVYDHGPTSGKLFAVGDRIVDVDGRHFKTTIDLKDHILWTSHNRDFFTTIIERPISEEANRAVADCLRPDSSTFSTIISTSA